MLERAKGIEPSYAAWEAAVLPLNYARRPRLVSTAGSEIERALQPLGRDNGARDVRQPASLLWAHFDRASASGGSAGPGAAVLRTWPPYAQRA